LLDLDCLQDNLLQLAFEVELDLFLDIGVLLDASYDRDQSRDLVLEDLISQPGLEVGENRPEVLDDGEDNLGNT